MKPRLIIVFCMVLISSLVFAAEQKVDKPAEKKEEAGSQALKTQKDKLSYAVGMDMGKFLKNNEDIDPNITVRAIKDMLAGNKTLLKEEESSEIMIKFQEDLMIKQQEREQAMLEKNKKDGEAFLAQNKTREGVKTLPSGLQYKVITEGKGKSPKETDTVVVQYRGTLINGTEFDSSYRRGKPETFSVGNVIRGWAEALQLMKEGSKWQLVIPSDLAYGEIGSEDGSIPPNTVLMFEIELVSIKAQ